MPYAQVDDCVRLYYEDFGDGPPIVFVHSGAATHDLWEHQVYHLSDRFRTVTYDHRGVGMSDKPRNGYTVDRLAYSLSPPVVAAVIDFEGGGRFQCELTDVDPRAVKIGDRVEMTFRRLFTANGVHNYFWKARPLRTA